MNNLGPRTANTYDTAPPVGYVAGIGRGATGFTTRSDIGPAGPMGADASSQPPAGYVAGRGRGMGDLAGAGAERSEMDRGDYSESNYDEFSGYRESLFNTPYDEEDLEADRIYGAIDDLMDSRRKKRREDKANELMKQTGNRPKIGEQFADLKRNLASVTADEWNSIPDVGDHSLKLKQQRRSEVFTPVPDFILDGGSRRSALSNSIDSSSGMSTVSGIQSVAGLAEQRGSVLSLKLDKMSDSVSGQTVIDPKGYLTDLSGMKVNSDTEIGDIKKARTLLHSVTSTNPKHAPGWIAAARIEEYAGKLVQARKVIRQGCEICGRDNEDVWLEAARLHSSENAKTILANAVKCIPHSVKIWLKASELEEAPSGSEESVVSASLNRKKIVLRKALELIPNSVQLWKAAIELESVTDARIMLGRAVECVPHSVEMWLALAKIETYDNAKRVLNSAREALPTEPVIWITAAKLEEAHGNTAAVIDRIIEKAIVSLEQFQVVIDRETWIKEAEEAEKSCSLLTCASIIKKIIGYNVAADDQLQVWLDDVEAVLSRSYVNDSGKTVPLIWTARAIYQNALSVYPANEDLWLEYVTMEREKGNPQKLDEALHSATKACPRAEIFWLMAAKEMWVRDNNVSGARAILMEAFSANINSEQIWLAAVKLEWENQEYERARILLQKARSKAPSERIWMKSLLLERETNYLNISQKTVSENEINVANTQEIMMIEEAITLYPKYLKFYLMGGQVCSLVADYEAARKFYVRGIESVELAELDEKSKKLYVVLWLSLIRIEETCKGIVKARSVVERARSKLGNKCEELWLESIELERRHGVASIAGEIKQVSVLTAQALQECPDSGLLWADQILHATKQQQKSKCIDALKKCDNNIHVVLAIARNFEQDSKVSKARKWYVRAVTLNPCFGDAWVYYYQFELRQQALRDKFQSMQKSGNAVSGNDDDEVSEVVSDNIITDIVEKCKLSKPNQGNLWCTVAKRTENRHCSEEVLLRKCVNALLK